jgi:hypothetical protein
MTKTLNTLISGMTILLVMLSLFSPRARADGLILSLDGLLPSKSDDPTVYPVLQETEWYYGTSWIEIISQPGFIEGRAVEYYRRYAGTGDIRSVEFYAYLFSDANTAEAYYNREINDLESAVGLTEVPLVGAFGGTYESGGMATGVSWGIVSNVVFKVAVYAYLKEDPTDQLIFFTSLERTRILDKGGIPSVPEFLSPFVVLLFGFATLVGTKLDIKKRSWK